MKISKLYILLLVWSASVFAAYTPTTTSVELLTSDPTTKLVTPLSLKDLVQDRLGNKEPIDWLLGDGATSNRRVEWQLPWSLGGSAISDSVLVRVPTANPSTIAVLLQFSQVSSGVTYTTGAHAALTLSNAGALQMRLGTDSNNRGIWEIAGWRAANSGKVVQLHFVSAADTATLPTVYQDGVALSGWVALPPAGTVPNWFAPALSLTFRSSGQELPSTEFRPGALINRALTASEIAQMVQTGALLPQDRTGGSVVPSYTSNFSAGVDGFNAQAGSVVGNVDGVSDGTTSYDDCLAYAGSGSGSWPAIIRNAYATPGNNLAYRFSSLRFRYYIPNSATAVQAIRLTSVVSGSAVSTNYSVKGTWTDVSIPIFAPALNLNNSLVFELWNGTTGNFTHTDTVYIRDVVITSLGALLQPEITRTRATSDVGSNGIPGAVHTGVVPLSSSRSFQITRTLSWAGTHEAKSLLGIPVFYGNVFIRDIITKASASSSGSGLTVGTTNSASRYVSANAYTTAKKVHALANRTPSGTATNDLDIIVDPDTNAYTGDVTITVRGEILDHTP